MGFIDRLLALSPYRRGPLHVRLAAALDLLGGGGGAPVNSLGFARSHSSTAQYLNGGAAPTFTTSGTLLFIGTPLAIGSLRGGMYGTHDGSAGISLWARSTSRLQFVCYDAAGSAISFDYIAGASFFGSSRRCYLTWEPEASQVRMRGGVLDVGEASVLEPTLKLTAPASDVGILAHPTLAGAGLQCDGALVMHFSSALSDAEKAADLATLLARPDLLTCPQPTGSDGDSITSTAHVADSGSEGRTYTPTNSPSGGSTPLTADEAHT